MSIATREVCVCDQCGRERDKDTNHWWVVCCEVNEKILATPNLFVTPWSEEAARWEDATHLCGLTCLYQAIDKLAQEILKRETVAK